MNPSVAFLNTLSVDDELIARLSALPFSHTGTRRICLHEGESSPLHAMLVESVHGQEFPGHYHADSDEVTVAVKGKLEVVVWDRGLDHPPRRLVLGLGDGETRVSFMPKGTPHVTKALDSNCIYLEVKLGPFKKEALVQIDRQAEPPGMRGSRASVFVVGIDSAIGAALRARLEASGVTVYGSTRRMGGARGRITNLDLAQVQSATLPDADAVVICAAIPSILACRTYPDATRAINVDAPLELAHHYASRNTFVVCLSTNMVFDGDAPARLSTDLPVPPTVYGRQKADLEAGILALGARAAVVRLTKVVSPEMALLRSWCQSLAKGEPISPFSNMVMAPIPLTRTADALARLAQRRSSGIYQLSATHDFSYADAAFALADMMNAPRGLVSPRPTSRDIVPAERPTFTSLDTTRAQEDLAWRPISPFDTLVETFSHQIAHITKKTENNSP